MEEILGFKAWLERREASAATAAKYTRDAEAFIQSVAEVSREAVLSYKEALVAQFKPSSVNSMIAAVNSFLGFIGKGELKLKAIKVQKKSFTEKEKELTKAEYERLLSACGEDERLYFLIQTIASTGIRVSELKFITVEALKEKSAEISSKGKEREILLPKNLCTALLGYAKGRGIEEGAVFVTKSGKPLDRSNIWKMMKKLAEKAGVDPKKVFPHNFRHFFARVFYSKEKDIVRLADILGHSSINTTRIYTMESGETHRRKLEALGILRL